MAVGLVSLIGLLGGRQGETGGLDSQGATNGDVIAVNIACVNISTNMHIKRWRQKYTSHEKKLKIKVVGIEFRIKKSVSAYVYLPPHLSWARGLERLILLKYIVLKQQNTFYLGLNAAENMHTMKKSSR